MKNSETVDSTPIKTTDRTINDVNRANAAAWDSGEFRHNDAETPISNELKARNPEYAKSIEKQRSALKPSPTGKSDPEQRTIRKNYVQEKMSRSGRKSGYGEEEPEMRKRTAGEVKAERKSAPSHKEHRLEHQAGHAELHGVPKNKEAGIKAAQSHWRRALYPGGWEGKEKPPKVPWSSSKGDASDSTPIKTTDRTINDINRANAAAWDSGEFRHVSVDALDSTPQERQARKAANPNKVQGKPVLREALTNVKGEGYHGKEGRKGLHEIAENISTKKGNLAKHWKNTPGSDPDKHYNVLEKIAIQHEDDSADGVVSAFHAGKNLGEKVAEGAVDEGRHSLSFAQRIARPRGVEDPLDSSDGIETDPILSSMKKVHGARKTLQREITRHGEGRKVEKAQNKLKAAYAGEQAKLEQDPHYRHGKYGEQIPEKYKGVTTPVRPIPDRAFKDTEDRAIHLPRKANRTWRKGEWS
jgi:hypothetical protein